MDATHDWNRRQYAAEISKNWNEATREPKRKLEAAFPGLWNAGNGDQFSKQRASQIYDATSGADAELRDCLVTMLNHFDFIAVTYLNAVADREMIDEVLKGTLLRWHRVVRNFIEVYDDKREYRTGSAWDAYDRLIKQWEAEAKRPQPHRAPTGGSF